MSYSNLIKKNVASAFKNIGDLGLDMAFNQSVVTGFDFGSNAPVKTSTTKTIKGIVIKTEKLTSVSGGNTITSTIIINSEEIDDISLYDTLTINSVVWNIISPITDNGYTIKLTATREV